MKKRLETLGILTEKRRQELRQWAGVPELVGEGRFPELRTFLNERNHPDASKDPKGFQEYWKKHNAKKPRTEEEKTFVRSFYAESWADKAEFVDAERKKDQEQHRDTVADMAELPYKFFSSLMEKMKSSDDLKLFFLLVAERVTKRKHRLHKRLSKETEDAYYSQKKCLSFEEIGRSFGVTKQAVTYKVKQFKRKNLDAWAWVDAIRHPKKKEKTKAYNDAVHPDNDEKRIDDNITARY